MPNNILWKYGASTVIDDGMMVEIGEGPGPEVVEALAISNEMRITQIANMLRCNPERIASVEAVLGISGFMGS